MRDAARHAAFDVLFLVDQRRRRRKLKLDALMNDIRTEAQQRGHWRGEDQALFHALCTGVVRHWWALEGLMVRLTDREMRRITPQVRTLLRLGLFQMLFSEGIPDYAAVSQTVTLAQQRKLSKKTAGFVNGVLRNAGRKRDAGELHFPALEDDPYGYATSVGALPNWLAHRLLDVYTPQQVAELCKAQLMPVPLSLRINTLKTTVDAACSSLVDAGYTVSPLPGELGQLLPEMIRVQGFVGSPTLLPGFAEGHLYPQDVSSARVTPFSGVQPGMTVVDMCAAPGSKTSHLAAAMQNQGRIVAVEQSESRLADLEANLARLGVTMATCHLGDATKITRDILDISKGADVVLVDAPCSGLGTLRKHPEIGLNLRAQDMAEYPATQAALLNNAAALLKPGGTVVYATCSIDPSENDAVIQTFLAAHPDWHLQDAVSLLTHAEEHAHWDGFYMARLTQPAV